MADQTQPYHPLAEVFGFPLADMSVAANRHRTKRLCPFNNKVPNCAKDKAQNPLGVCRDNTHGAPLSVAALGHMQPFDPCRRRPIPALKSQKPFLTSNRVPCIVTRWLRRNPSSSQRRISTDYVQVSTLKKSTLLRWSESSLGTSRRTSFSGCRSHTKPWQGSPERKVTLRFRPHLTSLGTHRIVVP